MPKAITKSKHNNQNMTKSSFGIALDTFIETGHFFLTNEILTTELLVYFGEYLKKQPKPLSEQNFKLCLSSVTFNLEVPIFSQEAMREAAVELYKAFLDPFFKFSSNWRVIALDNVTFLQGATSYTLSSYFVVRLLSQLEEINLTELSITKAEFHLWAWIPFLISPPQLDILTLDLSDEDKDDNLMILCEALQYAKIKLLNLGETEINVEGYQALNELLDKNYFIEKMLIKEPTDPTSRAIFKKINARLPENRTGKQRFDIVKFNQKEFLRFILNAQNVLQNETDENEIRRQKRVIEFLLNKKREPNITYREHCMQKASESTAFLDLSFFNPSLNQTYLERILNEARNVDSVYPNHAEYLDGRWSLFNLDLNQLADSEIKTIGYCLLEDALERNDTYMVNRLIEAGVNLFEQQGDEKPLLIQIFEKNREFKLIILDHIFYDRTFENTVERAFRDYSKGKEIMADMGSFFKSYAEILKKRICPYLLSDFQRLFNLFKDIVHLSRPSKQRDQEFIEIYWRMCKCLILFQDDRGKVTGESISRVQRMLSEIRTISRNADWGWQDGSQLHTGLRDRLGPLRENMQEIKQLVEKDDMINAKDRVIEQKDRTIKNLSEKCEHLETTIQHVRDNSEAERQQFKATIMALQAQLKAGKNSETSEELDEPGPSTRFFPRS